MMARLLAALALVATALAITPAAHASQQPCLDALGSSCGPGPVPVCRQVEVSTNPLLYANGAYVTVRLNSNCTVSVLYGCPATDTALPPTLGAGADGAAAAIALPHGDVQTTNACTASATETNTPCPNGFWHAPVSLTEGPVHVGADSCVPMCACYPMGATAASPNLPPIGPPCPSMGGCCGIEPEGGCCATTCGSPCPTAAVDTDQLKPVGPIDPSFDGVSVSTSGCTATIDQENDGFLACPHNWYNTPSTTDAGPVTVGTQVCTPPCACEPMAAPMVDPPCKYCAPPQCAPHTLQGTEVTVYEREDCSVMVDAHDQVTCSKGGWWPTTIDRKVGTEEVRVTFCLPEIECACDPILAPMGASDPAQTGASTCCCTCDPLPVGPIVAIQQPVGITFVTCVQGPCPPEVWCAPRGADVPGIATYTLDRSCHVTVSQDPEPCEAWHYESTTVGPLTVRRQQCDPGVQT